MKCADCCYFWREEDEAFQTCHWESRCPGDIPPCEEEEEEDVYEDEELETGFDPYEGCYTYDC